VSAKKPTTAITARHVLDAAKAKWSSPAFALFEQVGNATGFRTTRHADAVAVGIWPSRGYSIEGIEVKVSRADWLSELRNPKKADDIAKFCDRWWLVVGSEKIVQPGELPSTWGLLVLRGAALHCVTAAPKLECEAAPKSFMAAILRRAHEDHARIIAAAERRGFERGSEMGPDEHRTARFELKNRVELLEGAIKTFEEKSGIKIAEWTAGKLGEAVAEIMKIRRYRRPPAEELESTARTIEDTAKELREEAAKLNRVAELVNERGVA
jgi:hypothetical protein